MCVITFYKVLVQISCNNVTLISKFINDKNIDNDNNNK